MEARDRLPAALRQHSSLISVLVLGLALRLICIPLAHGPDFNSWDLDAQATLRGINVYAHPPFDPEHAGPFAYLPLYLYVVVALKWLAIVSGIPFVVLGKLPVVAGDLVIAGALAAVARRHGGGDGRQALMAGMFLLSPLVLYNGAYYGRFDSVCLAALLLAMVHLERRPPSVRAVSIWFALAVTLKTFPVILLPQILVRVGRRSAVVLGVLVAIPGLVSLPYLLWGLRPFVEVVVLFNLRKGPRQFSWQRGAEVLGLGGQPLAILGPLLLMVLAVGIIAIAVLGRSRSAPIDVHAQAAAGLCLFLLTSKVVYEQYLTWPLPFLIVLAVRDRMVAAIVAVVTFSLLGPIDSAYFHPLGHGPWTDLWMSLVVALAALAVVVSVVRRSWPGRERRVQANAAGTA